MKSIVGSFFRVGLFLLITLVMLSCADETVPQDSEITTENRATEDTPVGDEATYKLGMSTDGYTRFVLASSSGEALIAISNVPGGECMNEIHAQTVAAPVDIDGNTTPAGASVYAGSGGSWVAT